MYECPNCTYEQLHQIYTCMQCGHVVKEITSMRKLMREMKVEEE